jgi:uncharacterized membrane protein (DUF2068 family)
MRLAGDGETEASALLQRKGETVKRPAGVIVSAVLLLLGSLFQLLGAVFMALSGVLVGKIPAGGLPGSSPAPPMPGWMPVFMFALSAICVALAAWGIATTVGLFRMRRWARYSVLVIGGGLVLLNLFPLLSMAVLVVAPLPVPPSVDASQVPMAHAVTRGIFAVMAIFYAALCAIGVWWLAYFNLKRVREVFAGAPGEAPESRRPFLIAVIAMLSMIGAGFLLLAMFLPFPALFFGSILYGWGRVALYLIYAALSAAMGIGLWRLEQWGRWLTLGMTAIGLANSVVYFVRPSLMLQYTTELYRTMNLPQPPMSAPFQSMMPGLGLAFAVLYSIAILAILIYYRKGFDRPAEPPQDGLSQLA